MSAGPGPLSCADRPRSSFAPLANKGNVASRTCRGSVLHLARTLFLRGDVRLELGPADVGHHATGYQERYSHTPVVVEEHARYASVESHLANGTDPLDRAGPLLLCLAVDSRRDEQDHGRKTWHRHGETQ